MVVLMNAIEIKNLSYTYSDGTVALKDTSIKIKEKTKVAILGANGSGKSTLLQHLNGLILLQKGSIKVKNIYVEKENLHEVRRKVGIVFDNPDDQIFATTVYEDVAFGPRNLGYEEARVEKAVSKSLKLVDIEKLKDKPPFNLSYGQKKKVAIAGILAMNPEIIIFDEPFSGLDPYSLKQFLLILQTLYTLGNTIIITTHDVDIAYEWADECIILNKGKVLAQGKINLLENELLMKEARLRTPNMYEIFSNTNFRARNVEEGRVFVTRLFSK